MGYDESGDVPTDFLRRDKGSSGVGVCVCKTCEWPEMNLISSPNKSENRSRLSFIYCATD